MMICIVRAQVEY